MIKEAIVSLVDGKALTFEQTSETMEEIMAGQATPAQIGAFLTALRMKGETAEEIAGLAKVMRAKALFVKINGPAVDIVGTGGDGSGSFNISTAAAIVAAGAGLKVAKHGNRAATSKSGSADFLEALGVKIDLGPEGVARCVEEAGIGFMYAPRYHPAMKHAAAPRKEIGIRTAFNLLGPLTNPARAEHMVLGVPTEELGNKIASVLVRLGTKHSLVVHGTDGLDEISLSAKTLIWDIWEGTLSPPKEVTAETFGFKTIPRAGIAGGTPQENAETFLRILAGEKSDLRNVIAANAAAALVVGGIANNFRKGARLAEEAIDNGRARAKLDKWVELSRRLE